MTGTRRSPSGGDSIFVQIPAHRDGELWPTLRDLHAKAARVDRLRVAVLWQREEGETIPADVAALPGVEITEVDACESQGPNWARRRLRQQWSGERFTLMLD